jgi:cell division protein FtsZ
MYKQGIKDVEFVVCNTDSQALNTSPIPNKLQIGANLTEGLGCGANPEVGRNAALESKDQIREMLVGTKMVFITAGMGGGTGTGAAPVVAKIAKEEKILTIGIVTKPFSFEGKKRMLQAEAGIAELSEFVDALVVIPNERLKQISENRITLSNAFEHADEVLHRGVQSISDLINIPGIVNLDFADVSSVMRDAGYAHMGVGMATGRDKAEIAARMAVTSPLLETSISGATGILINITASPDISLDEVETASAMISNEAHPDANIIWGAAFDNTLEDTIKITVIATGFKSEEKPVSATPVQPARAPFASAPVRPAQPAQQPAQTITPENSGTLISDRDFDDIMNILRKNRG